MCIIFTSVTQIVTAVFLYTFRNLFLCYYQHLIACFWERIVSLTESDQRNVTNKSKQRAIVASIKYIFNIFTFLLIPNQLHVQFGQVWLTPQS